MAACFRNSVGKYGARIHTLLFQPLMDNGGEVTDQPYEAAIAAFGALIAGFCVGIAIFV